MSHWNHTVTFVIPIAQQLTAKRVSRSIDQDVGGFEAFDTLVSSTGVAPATHAVYSTPVRESFLQILQTSLADPAYLKALVAADYATRWPAEQAPSPAECDAFLSALQVFIDVSLQEALAQSGLSMIQAE